MDEYEALNDADEKPPTKIVIRRLPPDLTLETFIMQVRSLPKYNYLYFVQSDKSTDIGSYYSRAYINFLKYEDVVRFKNKFDNHVFVSGNGVKYTAVVEIAPYQKIHNILQEVRDKIAGTIEDDGYYKTFVKGSASHFESFGRTGCGFDMMPAEKYKDHSLTPLLKFIREMKQRKLVVKKRDPSNVCGKNRNRLTFVNRSARNDTNRYSRFIYTNKSLKD